MLSDLIMTIPASPAGKIRAAGRVILALDLVTVLLSELPDDEKLDGRALASYIHDSLRLTQPSVEVIAADYRRQLIRNQGVHRSNAYQCLQVVARCLDHANLATDEYDDERALVDLMGIELVFDLLKIPAGSIQNAVRIYCSGSLSWVGNLPV